MNEDLRLMMIATEHMTREQLVQLILDIEANEKSLRDQLDSIQNVQR